MRVFGAIMLVLGVVLIGYGVNLVMSGVAHWRIGELPAIVGFFLAWWGVNCLRDRRLRRQLLRVSTVL